MPGSGHQFRQMRLIKGNLARLQCLDFTLVGVDTSYLVPEESQAGSGGKAYISSSNDRNIHNIFLILHLSEFAFGAAPFSTVNRKKHVAHHLGIG